MKLFEFLFGKKRYHNKNRGWRRIKNPPRWVIRTCNKCNKGMIIYTRGKHFEYKQVRTLGENHLIFNYYKRKLRR